MATNDDAKTDKVIVNDATSNKANENDATVDKAIVNDATAEKDKPNEKKPKEKKPKEKKPKPTKEPKPPKPPKQKAAVAAPARPDAMFEEGFLAKLHKPGENPQVSPDLRDAHLVATGGKVYTRFPPEPNGYLHIGHSKAIAINFGFAKYHGGYCYLRYDDTNPEAEEAQYFESILETIRWLGFEPFKITYSSDYFPQLYELAVKLTKRGLAYVCHCTGEQIWADRGGDKPGTPRRACVHRERPIEESLAEFEKMRAGKYRPGDATLRMKQDLEDGNPQMWDLIAYRVLDAPHHRTGKDWCIYPTYDFTHCLCDSFENITHSLCTTEFILSRVSYEWLCDAVEVYKPRQSEYGRLSLEGTVMSKRKILKLVNEGYVSGWDDPRLYTLIALRRRGIPPGAILNFVNGLGVTTSKSVIRAVYFEQVVRQYLEFSTPRLMMLLDPLKVTLENVPDDFYLEIEKPIHPKIPEMGTNKVPFAKTFYVDQSDFRTVDDPDYYRLAPGKTVGLLQVPHPVTVIDYKTDPVSGKPVELICRYETEITKKAKAYIQWVGEHAPSGSPVRVDEVRIFNPLFKTDDPSGDDWLTHVDPNSLEVHKDAMIEVGFFNVARALLAEARKEGEKRTEEAVKEEREHPASDIPGLPNDAGHGAPERKASQLVGPECVRFQGVRVAYFALDKDSKIRCVEEGQESTKLDRSEGDRIVLNRIVALKAAVQA